MKKILLSAAALCVLMFFVNSSALQLGVGVKGGLALGTLTGKLAESMDSTADPSMKLGFSGYGFFSIDFVKFLGAQAELGFVNKGKTWTDKTNDKNKLSYNFNYLEMPILIKGIIPLPIVKPMFYIGPTFGILLGATGSMHSEDPGYPTFDTTMSIPDSVRNDFEFGLAIGAGATINVGPGAILLDVRYTFGFTSIPKLTQAEKAAGESDSDVELKTGTLAIMIGYQFKI